MLRARGNSWLMLLFLASIACIGFILWASSGNHSQYFNYGLNERSFSSKSLRFIETKTSFTFPSGSRGLKMYYRGWQVDPCFAAKIQIPAEAKTAVQSSLTALKNMEIHGLESLFQRLPWWTPSKHNLLIERTLDGRIGDTEYCVQYSLCAENNQYVLYILWMSY